MNPLKIIEHYYIPGQLSHQLLVAHSRAVADYAFAVARRLASLGHGINPDFVHEAAWLHDIGIYLTDTPELDCHGRAPYLMHGLLGAKILRREELPEHALVCERHIGVGLSVDDIRKQELPLPLRDMRPQSLAEEVVAYADLFFSKHASRPSEPRPAIEVRRKLETFGPGKVAIFDAWHQRFSD